MVTTRIDQGNARRAVYYQLLSATIVVAYLVTSGNCLPKSKGYRGLSDRQESENVPGMDSMTNTKANAKAKAAGSSGESVPKSGAKSSHESSSGEGTCPLGFTYLPGAGRCYSVVLESHDWYSAGAKCQALSHGSHLVAIESEAEQVALKTFLDSETSKNAGNTACKPVPAYTHGDFFWTSGQRQIGDNCESAFVWKVTSNTKLAFEYTNWKFYEPNCAESIEFCVDLEESANFGWNDIRCSRKICPVCEYNPSER